MKVLDNCNEYNVKFDSCEDFKTVDFNIDMKDIDSMLDDKKHKHCNDRTSSSRCDTKANLIKIIVLALLIRLMNST